MDAALLKRLDATLRSSLREASQILRERGVDNGALWAATQALVPILNLMRDLQSSGSGGVAGATGSPASLSGEVSPLPVFSDPLAEEEASKASAAEAAPEVSNVIKWEELRQRAAKLSRHDNERKPL